MAQPELTEAQAIAAALAAPRIRDWVARYEGEELIRDAVFDGESELWTVKVWVKDDPAGQIVAAKVEDGTKRLTEAWTGPQVAWSMARGLKGSFGRKINDSEIWFAMCAAFLVGLADWRRLLSVRNLDLLVLLSFTASWWFFNEGRIFTSVPLAYPPLLYVLGRMAWVGWKGRASPGGVVWPAWVLLAATVFLMGFRVGLNAQASNVIDVGLASVVGAQRIVSDGEIPYGHMPTDDGEPCGRENSEGYVRDHIQTNGRCEAQIARGDVYGPVTYLAYIPGYVTFGWSGRWDSLPAAHFTSIVFDVLAVAGLFLVGRRFGDLRFAAALAFAWAAYPFTQYVSSSNSNDSIMPVLLIWGFWLLTSPRGRGLLLGLASWAKFATVLLVPLWAGYPSSLRRPRGVRGFAVGLALASVLSLWIVVLEPNPLDGLEAFWDRTFGYQLSRPSPFSVWDWEVYRYPDLSPLQTALKVVLLVAAVGLAFVPRRRTPMQLAALSAALIVGFELVLTHWFYLYIPWFFPLAAFALLAPAALAASFRSAEVPHDRPVRELTPAAEARYALFAAAMGIAALLVVWGLLHVGWYASLRITDTPTYKRYGEAVMDGQVPYRDFDLEYPPGALPAFVLPSLAPAADYDTVFAWLMWACGAVTIAGVVLALRAAGADPLRQLAAAVFVAIAPLFLGSLFLSRFDLWPAALLVLALAALVSGRGRLGFGLLAAASAAKLYPLVVLPLALVYASRRWGGRAALAGLGVFVAVLAAIVVPFAVLAPEGLWHSLERQTGRPLQLESLASSILLVADRLGAYDAFVVSSYGSQNLDGSLADRLATVSTALQAFFVVAVWVVFTAGRASRASLVTASAAAVTAFAAFGKVLSPQFLVWLVPLVVLVGGSGGAVAASALAVALVLTQAWFPRAYWDVVAISPEVWLVLARNVVLVALFAMLLASIRSARGSLRSG